MSKNYKNTKIFLFMFIFMVFLASCAQLQEMSEDPEEYSSQRQKVMTKQVEKRDMNLPEGSTILDDDSAFNLGNIFDGFSGQNDTAYKVNSIVFDVALDQVSFMPLASVDSIAGIIVTDWYSLSDGNSRVKINIRIESQDLTDESITVSLFTQSLENNRWIDNGINTEQSLKIKKSILSKASSLKIASEL